MPSINLRFIVVAAIFAYAVWFIWQKWVSGLA